MRILVTGHKGYIGTVLVSMLHEIGHEVFGVDSEQQAAAQNSDGQWAVCSKQQIVKRLPNSGIQDR